MPDSFPKKALAIAAHPDDIEFLMAGTLLLLASEGWEIHYFNLSSGNCGSAEMNGDQTARVRAMESRKAARVLGAVYHPSIARDLEIFYEDRLLRRVAGVIRKVGPSIVLTHGPRDYMEDHMNTCRLAVTAAFARGMKNYRTIPSLPIYPGPVALYHALPHGLKDGMNVPVLPEFFVDTTTVHARKREALACHASQKEWLDVSQGMDSYLHSMDEISGQIARMAGGFDHAEGWSRHNPLGFCPSDFDPLTGVLDGKIRKRGDTSRAKRKSR